MSPIHPELEPLVAAMKAERPRHTHCRLTSGRVVPLVDRAWLDSNEQMRARNVDELLSRKDFTAGTAMSIGIAMRAFGLVEIARLQERAYQMRSRGITHLLDEGDVLALQAAGEALAAA